MKLADIQPLLEYMVKRHAIWDRRYSGFPKPWTKDPILQTYKFCNVYRELDKVTQWVDGAIRKPFAEHPNLWLMLCIARMINWPDTLHELIACPEAGVWPRTSTWKPLKMRAVMQRRAARGEKVYTGAYMLRGPIQGDPSGFQDKPHYTAVRVIQPLWEARSKLEPQLHGTLADAFSAFKGYHGWGDFLIAQVIADLKHTRYLRNAPDWWDWAVLGPGSLKGLNILTGKPLGASWKQENALSALREIQAAAKKHTHLKPLCLQDVQNNLCEFSKYTRGYCRSLYPGKLDE